MKCLISWSLKISHVYSWGQLPKPIGDEGLHFVTWVDVFTFEENVYVSISTMPDVHSNLSHIL